MAGGDGAAVFPGCVMTMEQRQCLVGPRSMYLWDTGQSYGEIGGLEVLLHEQDVLGCIPSSHSSSEHSSV